MTWKNLHWEDVAEGQKIPSASRSLAITDIIACAIASRDFMRLHHDREYAQQAGLRDIILNTPSLYGLTGKYLTDWAGPESELKEISLQILASCCPGDTLTTAGVVTKKVRESGMNLVHVDVTLSVLSGVAARARTVVALPA